MACGENDHDLHLFLDEELDETGRNQVREHLAECVDCRNHVRHIRTVETAVSRADWLEVSEDFTSRLMIRLEKDFPRRRLLSWRKYTIPAAVAVVLLGFVAGTWLSVPSQAVVLGKTTQADSVVIKGGEVVIPRNTTIKGHLTVENAIVRVYGRVNGDVTALNGKILMASGGDITGKKQEVNGALQWIAYYAKRFWNAIVHLF